MLVTISVLALSLGSFLAPVAPSGGARPAALASAYSIDVWKAENGLPQNSVQAIVQTRDGYLWLGTQEGLVRFDGVQFTIFDAGNTKTLKSSYIRALCEDPAGSLWIGTDGGGLSRFRDGVFTGYTTADGLSHNTVSSLADDADGGLWVGTYGGGLSHRDGAGGFRALTTRDGLPSNLVKAVHRSREGSVWIGTDGSGLGRWKDGALTSYGVGDSVARNTINAIREDARGQLWIGTSGGIYRFKGGRFTPAAIGGAGASAAVYAITEDRDGGLWIGTGGKGLHRLGEDGGGKAASFGLAEGLSNEIVYAIVQDREGSVWVGTGGGGLDRLRRGPFSSVSTRRGLSHDQTSAVLEDRDGVLWIGTWGGGLNRLQGRAREAYTSRRGLSSDIVSSLFEDRRGDLWIGTYGAGLNRLRDGTITTYDHSKGLANDTVWGLCEDRDGVLWIGTSGGLSRREHGVFRSYTSRDGLSNDMVRAVHCGATGVWLGTNGGGLLHLENGRFVSYTTKDGLASDLVYAIYEDTHGVLWIGTGGGLSRYESGTLTSFTTQDGLCESRVFQILEDRNGYLWMSSNKGISRVARKDLETFARTRGGGGRIGCTLYGLAAGMKSAECSGGSQPAGWKTRDGSLWFPTIEGVVVIDPDRTRTSGIAPPVVIETVLVDKSPASSGGNRVYAELPPGSGELEFHYAALSFLDPDKIRFQYRLEGFDEDWIDAGTRRAAYYTNIPPGAYRFRVKACNSDGLWNETGAAFDLRLRPHVYETRTFLGGVLLGGVLLAFALYRLRVKSLKSRERELGRLVRDRTRDLAEATRSLEEANRRQADFVSGVTHELKTPLTLIRLYCETLLYGRGGSDEEQGRYCEIITRECERLSQLVDRVLEASRLERGQKQYHLSEGDLAATVSGTVEAYAKCLARQGFSVATTLSPALPPVRFDPDGITEAVLNLLDNAAKYSGTSRDVSVRLYPR